MDDARLIEQLVDVVEDGKERETPGLDHRVAEQRAIARTLNTLRSCEHELDPDFAERIMARLPTVHETRAGRLWRFLSTPRQATLRWRPAMALWVLLVPVAVTATFLLAPSEASHPMAVPDPGTVTFVFVSPDARSVSVAGGFNRWDPESLPMVLRDPGVWTATIRLAPGRHEYMFVVDGEQWVTDPRADAYRYDGFGRTNAVIEL